MKKLCLLLTLAVLLCGCNKKDYETRAAPCGVEEITAPGVISIDVPDGLSAPVMSTQEGDRLYIADHYEVSLQTMAGGDIDATLKSCTGFDSSRLTLLETAKDGLKRYDCAFTALGEAAQTVGRLTVLDDGNYHYVLTVITDGAYGAEMTAAWQQLSDSFQVNIVR